MAEDVLVESAGVGAGVRTPATVRVLDAALFDVEAFASDIAWIVTAGHLAGRGGGAVFGSAWPVGPDNQRE